MIQVAPNAEQDPAGAQMLRMVINSQGYGIAVVANHESCFCRVHRRIPALSVDKRRLLEGEG